jgi:hypothetical protein
MTTTINQEYETSDLTVAAFLLAHGRPLIRVGGDRGSRRTFVFAASERDLAETFYIGASVPARAFSNATRDLKSLIYH